MPDSPSSTTKKTPCEVYNAVVSGWLENKTHSSQIAPATLFGNKSYFYEDDGVTHADKNKMRKLYAYKIISYLEFLIWAEQGVVTEVCDHLKSESMKNLSPTLKAGAESVKAQEYNHSCWAYDLLRSVENSANVKSLWCLPLCGVALDELVDRYPEHEMLSKTLLVILAEIIDFKTASRLISNECIADPIRKFAQNHETEEILHRVYFGKLLEELWDTSSPKEREYVAKVTPKIMYSFVAKNTNQEQSVHDVIFGKNTYIIVSESDEEIWKAVRTKCSDAIKYYERMGVFREKRFKDHFFAYF